MILHAGLGILALAGLIGTITADYPYPPDLNCEHRADGVYWWGCKAYQKCVDGYEVLVTCWEGEAFNQHTKRCDSIDHVPAPCGTIVQCDEDVMGAYRKPDHSTGNPCEFFYTCLDGRFLGHQKCIPGTVFDEYTQFCNWPDNVPPPCGWGERPKQKEHYEHDDEGNYWHRNW